MLSRRQQEKNAGTLTTKQTKSAYVLVRFSYAARNAGAQRSHLMIGKKERRELRMTAQIEAMEDDDDIFDYGMSATYDP